LRPASLLIAALACAAATAEAQQPTVSRNLTPLLARDTVVRAWFFGSRDHPLEAVAAAVADVGGRERRRSRWLHAVSAEVSTTDLAAAAARSEFRHLQLVARFRGRPEPPRETPLLAPTAGATAQDSLYAGGSISFPWSTRGCAAPA
jgi:hypothetical protein